MKLILAGGGTGGHLYPGIALAQEFSKQKPEIDILFMITQRKIDQKIVSNEGWPYKDLPVKSFRGLSWQTTCAFYYLFLSVVKAFYILRSFRPSLIIGLGAYPSVPTLIAGKLCSVPLVIHEQNYFPGGANKLFSHWVEKIFISFEETRGFFSEFLQKKIVVSGNPIRQGGITSEGRGVLGEKKAGKSTVLIFGGSKGARRINEAVCQGLSKLSEEKRKRVQIIHQTGVEDHEKIQAFYEKKAIEATILPFIHKMMEAYQQADLVVCRAGATTLAEITLLGKASILIPYPFAVKDHQMINANSLYQAGAAGLIADKELTGDRLWEEIFELIDNPQKMHKMAKASKRFGKPEAARVIVRESINIIKEGGRGKCF